jgi:hypothetical protein
LRIGTADGSAVDSNRLAKMDVRYTTSLAGNIASWARLTNSLVLTNGVVRVDAVDTGTVRYFIAAEQP